MPSTLTFRQAIDQAASRLAESDALRINASRDATLLLLHTVGLTRAQLLAAPDRTLSSDQAESFELAVGRRLQCEPVQYITGEQEFFGLPLRVTSDVLIPRPETEHLVESVLSEIPSRGHIRIADVGTGSGAIAIALAHKLPDAQIVATDISCAALEIAKDNAVRHNVLNRIRFLQCSLLDCMVEEGEELLDAVVSNPPYIPLTEAEHLHPEVRDFEPATALFAGSDGLEVYRKLIPQAQAALREGGPLAMEIGHGQRAAVAALLVGWGDVHFVNDLQHIPRVAVARRV